GYASYDSTQFQGEVLIYPYSIQSSFAYAEQNGYEMIIRSTTGLIAGLQLAQYFPLIKLVMPSGSNSFVQTYSGDIINSPVIITGAGVDSNITGYKIDFFSIDPITGTNLSSFSNSYIAGQIAFIANSLQSSLDSAKYLARSTGSNDGAFDTYSGFGKIIIERALADALPVELAFFTGKLIDNEVELRWRTETEVNNYGFSVERTTDNLLWSSIGFVEGHGNSNSPKEYRFSDFNIGRSDRYYYRLKQIDNDGTFEYSDIVIVEVGVPDNFYLSQNYPNPFNPQTRIDFTLPEAQFVSLKVYNLLGQLVSEIINEEKESGSYSVTFDASYLSSGIYVYRLETTDFIGLRKMTLLK
ncbi:MAG: T9SS type A sorting domain-containing protein, partial [Bacteroidetes bacterium]|nr:T9SS type A sorting domain-containing protein [Bacteroidota bacterium]